MSLHLLGQLQGDQPLWFSDLLRTLLVADLAAQLPGSPVDEVPRLSEDDARKLLGHASELALSSEVASLTLAYEITTRLIELFENRMPGLVAAADLILSRIGNFPGRHLLRERWGEGHLNAPNAPARLDLERIARELENAVEGPDGRRWQLTDFQLDFLAELGASSSVSVSAPTSAGKSFVLALDLIRRLHKDGPACVVYLVPTRALIREVTFAIRTHLRQAGLDTVPVRSVPFPISQDQASQGAVFVLTQERLMSLLHSRDGDQWITTLVVDEAQSIGDDARGVILQSAIEAVMARAPNAEVHFASPLARNPEFLLDVIGRRQIGHSLIGSISPVAQNLILVSQVDRRPLQAQFQLIDGSIPLDLGIRDLPFRFRDSPYAQRAALAQAITRDDESTLLYGNLPHHTEELAIALVEGRPQPNQTDRDLQELVDFIRTEVHTEYPLLKCLPHGVAYDYGNMPALVRARVEDLCRAGKLRFVCCTSTLLQGINLPARHIIIENPKRGQSTPMRRGDFLNLAGRAGRLLQEFHGNVWCIRPGDWEERSYVGDPLQDIHSAIDEAMSDGGTIVQKVLDNLAGGKELDYGEAAFGKLYCDFIRGGRELSESEWRNDANAAVLAETADRLQRLNITLPTDVLDANRAVRPDRMQMLYEYLQSQADLSQHLPLPPFAPEANDRMGQIIQVVHDKLGDVQNESYRFYKQLAVKWVYGTPLAQIISQHVGYLRSTNTTQSVSAMIRDLLRDLDEDIRFRLVKYYMAYTSVLEVVLRERGEVETADALEPFHVYLECGASDRVSLNLIALGLSRSTALSLKNSIQFDDDMTPEQCMAQLTVADLKSIRIPALCIREIKDLLGRE